MHSRPRAQRLSAECASASCVVLVAMCCCVTTGRNTASCSVLQCVVVWCSVVQCGAVLCSVLQYVTLCRSVLQCVAVKQQANTICSRRHSLPLAFRYSNQRWCILNVCVCIY